MRNGNDTQFMVAPIMDWTWMTIQEVRSEMTKEGYDQTHITDDFFKDVVINIVEDAICDRLYWVKNKTTDGLWSSRLEIYLDSLPWFDTTTEFAGFLYSIIDRVIVTRIRDIISLLIPSNNVYIWTLKKINKHDLYIIERGEDHRIEEYYRLKRTYEPEDFI